MDVNRSASLESRVTQRSVQCVLFGLQTAVSACLQQHLEMKGHPFNYNLINNFSIIACGARCAHLFATAYLLTSAQHQLRTGIVRVDRELFHQIITYGKLLETHFQTMMYRPQSHLSLSV